MLKYEAQGKKRVFSKNQKKIIKPIDKNDNSTYYFVMTISRPAKNFSGGS
jgi:hypothetical protein